VSLHVGFLVPRYGRNVIGGAENGARLLGEHLVKAGCTVEIFTTCAMDATTWATQFPAGTTEEGGVTVHRFTGSERRPDFESLSFRVLANPSGAARASSEDWLQAQGPVCPDAVNAAVASQADVVVCYPYLYWPIVMGIRALGPRAVLQPATHDEAPIYLPLYEEVFTQPGGLIFHSEAERRLTERIFPSCVTLPQAVVGLGIDEVEADVWQARAALGIGERPYLLCVGRVDSLKGATLLAEWFEAYKIRRPGSLALVFLGPVVDRPPAHPDIVVAGAVSEEIKWGALAGCEALVSPSPYESFSLVLLEAWAAGRPALINARCAATVEHALRAGAAVPFDGYGTFEAALDRLLRDRTLGDLLGAAGKAYVERLYRWPVLIERYSNFLESVAMRARNDLRISRSRGPTGAGYLDPIASRRSS
jgi:glycosyltransferase involved in cell wall biosynthesis